MQAIDLSKGSYVRLSTLSAIAVKSGLSVQVWVRPIEMGYTRAIFECARADGDWNVSLQMLPGGQLRLRVADSGAVAQLDTAPVAVASRWFNVCATISHDGDAVIYVDGAPIAAGKLRGLGDVARDAVTLGVSKIPGMTPLAASLAELRLWGRVLDAAEVPNLMRADPLLFGLLMRVKMESDGDGLKVVSPEVPRTATPVGPVSWRSDIEPDVLPRSPRGVLQLAPSSSVQLPSLITDLSAITFEAWICPKASDAGNFVEFGRNGSFSFLTWKIDSRRGAMQLEFIDSTLRRASTPWFVGLRVGVWQHVAVSFASGGACVFLVNGVEVGRCSATLMPLPKGVVIGNWIGAAPGQVGVAGEVAELRIWQRALTPTDIGKRWFWRACGDEPQLAYCYHGDDIRGGTVLDASRQGRHGKLGGMYFASGRELPLRPIVGGGSSSVKLTALLRHDDIPLALFGPLPQLPWLVLPKFVKVPVFEVRIELYGPDGTPGGGQVRVRVDEAVRLVRSDGGVTQVVDWTPGSDNAVTVPACGVLRLRILSTGRLDCPMLRVCPTGPGDRWSVVRPAEAAQGALGRLTGTDLQHPPTDKRPVLPPTLSAGDAAVVTDFIGQLGLAVSQRMSSTLTRRGWSWDPIIEWIEGAAEEVEDGVDDAVNDITSTTVELANGAKALVLRAGSDVKGLYQAVATYGSATIGDKVEKAEELAVDSANAVWGVIELVGKTAEGAFRVVLSGIDDMVDAISAVLKRIGAEMSALVEYLSVLFRWDKILAASDTLYDYGKEKLAGLLSGVQTLAGFEAAFDQLFQELKTQPIGSKTVGELLQLSKASDLPAIFTYLTDLMNEGFGSGTVSVNTKSSALPPAPAGDAVATRDAVTDLVPAGLVSGVDALKAMPLSTLLAVPDSVWQASKPVTVPMIQWIVGEAVSLTSALTEAMTAHLDVPVLTETLESSVLAGRSLNLLRLVALVGAIPATLATTDAQRLAGRGSVTAEALRWTQLGAHVVSGVLMVGRAVAEAKKDKKWLPALTICAGAVNGLVAGIHWYEMTQMDDSAGKKAAIAHATFESINALWQIGYGVSLILNPAEDTYRTACDVAVDITCGLGEVGASIADLCLPGDDPGSVRSIVFRGLNWLLRGCYRVADAVDDSKFKYANATTIGIGAAILLVDGTDLVWEIVDIAKG